MEYISHCFCFNKTGLATQIKLLDSLKYLHGLVTPKAKGSYFGPKHLQQTTLSYIHFIDNTQAKPR